VANAGCPEVINPTAAELKQISDYAKEVTFKLGKISLKEEAKAALQAIAAIMSEYPKANFSVEGHTDSIGTNSDFNQLLSERRAEVVVDFLVENGVAKSRLSFTGFGEDKPVGDNLTAAGRLSNRRVEINLAE
jgi:outer membrane protein OmpA-like peptidoglycan-associated protein